MSRTEIEAALASAGCVAPREEAALLLEAAGEGAGQIDDLVARRVAGEPLAWVVGWARFCGIRILVDLGVFVPRPHTEALAERAAALFPVDGVAVDLCTGSGAIAAVLSARRPRARVLATDLDPAAVACARRNGVEALEGDLDQPLPLELRGRVDVVTAAVPYVPTDEIRLLPRDVREREPVLALDGGTSGTDLLERAATAAAQLLRPGGAFLLEIGADQAAAMTSILEPLGFDALTVHTDDDGQDRALEARRGA